ncbi:ATP-binding protein [Nocardiopsis sp. CNT312]|uniref:ATP-binding protein n=1 Tax=Nocardiopsis sp. CNT312 TaxID=1137268 RepID=UPI00048C12D3|nr:ATP-binding protein [Nocardiopsis sp. CNT312]
MPATVPVSTPPPVPILGEATVPLSSFIQPACRHYFSGRPGGSYTLLVHRHRTGLHLTCHDRGGLHRRNSHLKAPAHGPNPEPEPGRGLALVDALSTDWGDNGQADFRRVWFHLAYDLTGSRWNTPADT